MIRRCSTILPHLEYEEVWQGWQEGGNPGKEGEQVGARWGKGAHHCLVPGQWPMIVVWWGFREAAMFLLFSRSTISVEIQGSRVASRVWGNKLVNFQPQQLSGINNFMKRAVLPVLDNYGIFQQDIPANWMDFNCSLTKN